jgi:hypothetical protein
MAKKKTSTKTAKKKTTRGAHPRRKRPVPSTTRNYFKEAFTDMKNHPYVIATVLTGLAAVGAVTLFYSPSNIERQNKVHSEGKGEREVNYSIHEDGDIEVQGLKGYSEVGRVEIGGVQHIYFEGPGANYMVMGKDGSYDVVWDTDDATRIDWDANTAPDFGNDNLERVVVIRDGELKKVIQRPGLDEKTLSANHDRGYMADRDVDYNHARGKIREDRRKAYLEDMKRMKPKKTAPTNGARRVPGTGRII